MYSHHDTPATIEALAWDKFLFDDAYTTRPVATESFRDILAGRRSVEGVAGENLYQRRMLDADSMIVSNLQEVG